MDAVGVIMECNPFHRGHGYFLDEIKKRHGTASIIAVMSGDFVQRGEPAILSKKERTEALLDAGADLVLELPVRFSLSNARSFARGAVGMLSSLPAVKKIIFGSESGDINELKEFAEKSAKIEEEEAYKTALFVGLRQGQSYAAASSAALSTVSPEDKNFGSLIATPNNLLGTEYIRAIACLSSGIEAETIKRIEGVDEDSHIFEKDGGFPLYYSATKARSSICSIHKPVNAPHLCPVTAEDFSLLLYDKLLSLSREELTAYEDIIPHLANSIKNNLSKYTSFSGYASLLQSKNYTYARIKRGLFHIILDLKKVEKPVNYTEIPLRVLGMKRDCTALLKNAKAPVITTGASVNKYNKEHSDSYINESINASLLYRQVMIKKFNEVVPDDYHIYSIIR